MSTTTAIANNKNKPKITNVIVTDKYSKEKVSNLNDPYPNEEDKIIDKVVYETVYRVLNEKIANKFDELQYLFKVKKEAFIKEDIVFTEKDIEDVLNEIKEQIPTLVASYDNIKFEIGVLFYLVRFLFDLLYALAAGDDKLVRLINRYKKYFLLNHVYKIFFRKLTHARSFVFQQANNLIIFSRQSISKILPLLQAYTDIDEDTLIIECVTSYCSNAVFKFNPFKAKNLAASIKSVYRRIISYKLSIKVTVDDDDTEIDTSYQIISDNKTLQHLDLQLKYTFLTEMLKTSQILIDNYIINEQSTSYKYLMEIAKTNYQFHDNIKPNIIRLLNYILHDVDIHKKVEVYKTIYNDLYELLKLYIPDNKIKLDFKKKYPELYRFMKAIVVSRDEDSKRGLIFRFDRKGFKSSLISKLTIHLPPQIDREIIEQLANEISKQTSYYFSRVIFIDAISNIPIRPYKPEQFTDELAMFFVEFLTS